MKYLSTRGQSPRVDAADALERGLAPDGGLYVPEELPTFDPNALDPRTPIPALAARVLAPFFAGSPLENHVEAICREALNFPIPLVPMVPTAEGPPQGLAVLELFHGPTAAFKDVGARFLAAALERLDQGRNLPPRTLLVATSGDTGGAVAAAFHGRQACNVVILFPDGGVSARQRRQLTGWGGNVRAFAVRGSFDDCQRMLKTVLGDPDAVQRHRLTTANSINLGRILPQCTYYAWASLRYRAEHGCEPDLVIPAGNIGNSVVALWARAMGFPIAQVHLATNANCTVPDFMATGLWVPRPSVPTLANAMDVGDPSNMERVFHAFPNPLKLGMAFTATSVDDPTISRVIQEGPGTWNRIWDPHTATAVEVARIRKVGLGILVATAHPAKFETIVEPLIGNPVPIPPALAAVLDRPEQAESLEPTPEALRGVLDR